MSGAKRKPRRSTRHQFWPDCLDWLVLAYDDGTDLAASECRTRRSVLYDLVQVRAVSGAVTRTSPTILLFPFSEVPRDLVEQYCQIAERLRLSLRIGQDRCEPIASCSLFEIPGCNPAMRIDLMF